MVIVRKISLIGEVIYKITEKSTPYGEGERQKKRKVQVLETRGKRIYNRKSKNEDSYKEEGVVLVTYTTESMDIIYEKVFPRINQQKETG